MKKNYNILLQFIQLLNKNDIKLNKLLRYVDEDINLANPLSNLAYIAVGDGTIDTIMYIESPPTENINYLRDVRGLK